MKVSDIRFVAIYLRKSRGDEETALDKHRMVLTNLCKENGWKFIEFAEIGTGDSILVRPEMQKLLREIEAGTFDAVVVDHIDRLGRGDKGDQARIEKAFTSSETLIVTPQKVYDLNNESDMTMLEFQSLIARMEYKQITRRMRQGKRSGALKGNWTNGTPPFPYVYDPQRKGLVVDQTKLPIYRDMVEKVLSGTPVIEVTWELNRKHIPSPRGGYWTDNVVRRILLNEVHLGRILYNKSEGGMHKNKPNEKPLRHKPKEEWIIVENCHEPVKTIEEHNKILYLFQKRKMIPHAVRAEKHPLSGLIRCAQCGYAMHIQKRKDIDKTLLLKCNHRDAFGNMTCKNHGSLIKVLEEGIKKAILSKKELLQGSKPDNPKKENDLNDSIKEKIRQITEQEKVIERIDNAYLSGIWGEDKYRTMLEKAERRLKELEADLHVLQLKSEEMAKLSDDEMLLLIEDFEKAVLLEQASREEHGKYYRSLIDYVYWEKEDTKATPTIKVNFL
jgi:DNA invertase Pin-like site-specific DNA recombinase